MSTAVTQFSIIIPVWNAGRFIERTLDCVRLQSWTDYEVVITNDGSTDNTEDVIRAYMRRYETFPVRLATQPNKGIGAARNNSIMRSRGGYLAFLDADDLWYPQKLKTVHDHLLAAPGIDVVYHDEAEVQMNGAKQSSHYGKLPDQPYQYLLLKKNPLSPSATVVRRTRALEIGGFSEELKFNSAEDYDFWLRLAKTGAVFKYLPLQLGEYIRTDTSITRKILYHYQNVENVIQHHLDVLAQENRYNPSQIAAMRQKRIAAIITSTGRAFYLAHDLQQAQAFYGKSLKQRPLWWKNYAGLLQVAIKRLRT